ncbi:hypothetical protein GCM10010398_47730 [Streptomyces fimbriatus]
MKSLAREGDSEAGGTAQAPVATAVSTAGAAGPAVTGGSAAAIGPLSGRAAPPVLVSMPTDLTARRRQWPTPGRRLWTNRGRPVRQGGQGGQDRGDRRRRRGRRGAGEATKGGK